MGVKRGWNLHTNGVREKGREREMLDGGHDVLVLISEVWGGFSLEAMRFLGELA